MFSSEDGYKTAMTGVYIGMGAPELYGKTMSMDIPEMMVRHWSFSGQSTNVTNRLANLDYTDSQVETLLDGVWTKYYNVIVQLNDVIDHINVSNLKFTNNTDVLIRGEALGLRAFLHFDLLRLFGPVPSALQGDPQAIPYVIHKTKNPTELVAQRWSKVIGNIEQDLLTAAKLLRDVDPIMFNSNAFLNHMPAAEGVPLNDDWQYYRQSRFNYYACLGALARFYQWTGQKDKAVEYAKIVVEAKNDDGSVKFPLTIEVDLKNASTTLTMWNEYCSGYATSACKRQLNHCLSANMHSLPKQNITWIQPMRKV